MLAANNNQSPPRCRAELIVSAARARCAMTKPVFLDPVDRDQLRVFAEWLEERASQAKGANDREC